MAREDTADDWFQAWDGSADDAGAELDGRPV